MRLWRGENHQKLREVVGSCAMYWPRIGPEKWGLHLKERKYCTITFIMLAFGKNVIERVIGKKEGFFCCSRCFELLYGTNLCRIVIDTNLCHVMEWAQIEEAR